MKTRSFIQIAFIVAAGALSPCGALAVTPQTQDGAVLAASLADDTPTRSTFEPLHPIGGNAGTPSPLPLIAGLVLMLGAVGVIGAFGRRTD